MSLGFKRLIDITPVIGNNGEEKYKILKLSAYYETAKFTGGPIRLVRQIKVGGILKQGK